MSDTYCSKCNGEDNELQKHELECIEYHKNDLDNIQRIIIKRIKELEEEGEVKKQ